jgi:hypothetical protein
MMAFKKLSPGVLLVIGFCFASSSAEADGANSVASVQRIQAMIAAQSMLGHPPLADSQQTDCCCPSMSSHAYAAVHQQIVALSATLRQTPKPPKLSPAMLAEGAY